MSNGAQSLTPANIAAAAAVVVLTVYRALHFAFSGETWPAVMSLMAGLMALTAIAALSRAKHAFTTAFFVPSLLLAIYGLVGFTLYGFARFTLIYVGICCIGLLYFNKKAFLCLLIFGTLFTAFLIFAAPALRFAASETLPDGGAFVALLLIAVLLYLICAGGAVEAGPANAPPAQEEVSAAVPGGSDFLAGVSHALRAPMNVILDMAGAARNTENQRHRDECLHEIETAAAQLLDIVNDLFDMSRLEADKLELSCEEFEFNDMLRRIADKFRPQARAKQQDFSVRFDDGIPRTLIGDELRLSQIIAVLLANAVKFTPERGAFRLVTQLTGEENGVCTVKIEVSDNGIGISSQQRERLFHPALRQESAAERQSGGAGLGLVIAKRIVELMGGRMWVESQPGKGASFAFTARLKRGQGSLADRRAPDAGFRGYHILLAESVPINREIVLALLEPTEIGVDCAKNGTEAVEMYAAAPERYDMIWLDVRMAEMDGREAARRIRALPLPRARFVPIVAMADAGREDKDECLRAGMNDLLYKPLAWGEVLSKLRKYLSPGNAAGAELAGVGGEFDWSHGLAWSSELETGNEKIDAQHQQLFRLTSALVDACAKGRSTAVLGEALDFLAAYTVRHFADEEALQIHYGFPEYDRHKKMHDDFKDAVAALITEYKTGESAEELSDKVYSVIVRWLVQHIRGEDAKIAEHIRSVSFSRKIAVTEHLHDDGQGRRRIHL